MTTLCLNAIIYHTQVGYIVAMVTAMYKKDDLLERLRRVEGQIRGIHRMIEDERECSEIMTQVAASLSALDKVGFMIVSRSLNDCIAESLKSGADHHEAVDKAVKLLMNFTRHSV
ncbi:MAG: metal-sensitive transcriptional regulator [Candidatus Xenobiia bacterium LiM19]